MAAIKLQKFLGIAPRISSELLPDGAGQVGRNIKLYSGDLLPYHDPVAVDSAEQTGTLLTLYGMRNADGTIAWLSWDVDVDLVVASDTSDDDQRVYFTGDGVPKVTTYALATTGAEPYPVAYYELGLPLPSAVPTAVATAFSAKATSTRERDAGNTAIIVTGSDHGLRSGNIISVSGMTDSTFDATNVRVTVTDTDTLEYFNSGAVVASGSDTGGSVDLAGNTITRQYVYTWVTPWLEESIGSSPSDELFIKEGQTVTVSNLPGSPPAGDNFIRGIRLYRTLTSASGTEFYRLSTMWFAASISTVARADNVVTVVTPEEHNLAVDDKFKLSGCTDATFDITGGTVLTVPNEFTFTFAQTDADVSTKAEATGTIKYNVAELPGDTPRYWDDGSTDFTDDFDYLNLTEILDTDEYDAPHEDMIGIRMGQNNMLVGFFDNQLCFAEPAHPHAWPIKYRRTFEYNIVAIESVGGYIIVLTEEFAYRVSGNDPSTLSIAKIDTPYPCLSKRSVVNMGYGVVYSTHGGLGLWSPSTGIQLVTEFVHDWDTWEDTVDPASLVAVFHEGKYFASHTTGSMVFERDEKIGGYFVDVTQKWTAGWTDPITNKFYFIQDTTGDIYEWDVDTQPLASGEWKSKTIVTKDYINLGAARVIADFDVDATEVAAITAYNDAVPTFNAAVWADSQELRTMNGPTDYVGDAGDVNNFGALNCLPIHHDDQTRSLRSLDGQYPVTFKLWVNKALIFTKLVTDKQIFRLPSGYKADTFELGVSGRSRIRAIHVGETPHGLRKA